VKIKFDARAFEQEAAFIATFISQLDQEESKLVLEESNQGEMKIVDAMPVLTGRARSSWGRFKPEFMNFDNPDLKSSDAIWEVENGGKSITQGTQVEYTPGLNEGSSRQAPAGFIDAIALLMLEDLEQAVGDAAERLWSGR
jgi:hypothetical protein